MCGDCNWPMEEKPCKTCEGLTSEFLKYNPTRKGYAMCKDCIEKKGIALIDISTEGEAFYAKG